MSMVNQLAYVGAGTADLDAWRIYAGEVLGHQIMPDTDDHALYLRFDDRHHRLVISPADVDDVSYVGWEVNNRAAMDRAASAISDAGVEILEGSPGEADLRRVLG
ncbi:MAG: 2,3-dihydroxyethylbenzene 1,2-dioxygenase, partial [Mycobacterium sp.]|nr:2,3-dihydroxyethylbenzene 1,2-dioxygenase [Mycobacterium sp.]